MPGVGRGRAGGPRGARDASDRRRPEPVQAAHRGAVIYRVAMLAPARAAVLLAAVLCALPFVVPACSEHFPDTPSDAGADDATRTTPARCSRRRRSPAPRARPSSAPQRAACSFDGGRLAGADHRHRLPGRRRHPHQPRHRDRPGEPLLRSLPRPAGRRRATTRRATSRRTRRRRPAARASRTPTSSTARRPAGPTPTATAALRRARTRTTSTASAPTTAGAPCTTTTTTACSTTSSPRTTPTGSASFFYEDDTVIPFYYALASTFAVGDRYFCLGPQLHLAEPLLR